MRHLISIAIVTAALAVSACNTVAGVGRDVQSVGETVEDVAE
ncbi:entericidin A/B family lipoprotein [Parasphingopyxis marina]|uniref:Entericidin A/B family lipoprotein n=1 Tax=Parasphingopyxis marina TaxID=2761622 RepID=A0A842HYI4_9SPHN|nr:entericidin A/B family lipoprotein [Parasphingopyxis marina]MBC2776980.1 entericidin A/B family lipoprotein [Parasphingopyxis marina]